mmetsp:Transcript_3401/g.8078  ORF Transcript_3401/g.8078 Transcript_3401/m.8078 type:complete len:142 (+) Transcript_3401:597-1022(+)
MLSCEYVLTIHVVVVVVVVVARSVYYPRELYKQLKDTFGLNLDLPPSTTLETVEKIFIGMHKQFNLIVGRIRVLPHPFFWFEGKGRRNGPAATLVSVLVPSFVFTRELTTTTTTGLCIILSVADLYRIHTHTHTPVLSVGP